MTLGTIALILAGAVAFTGAATAVAAIVYFTTRGEPIRREDVESR